MYVCYFKNSSDTIPCWKSIFWTLTVFFLRWSAASLFLLLFWWNVFSQHNESQQSATLLTSGNTVASLLHSRKLWLGVFLFFLIGEENWKEEKDELEIQDDSSAESNQRGEIKITGSLKSCPLLTQHILQRSGVELAAHGAAEEWPVSRIAPTVAIIIQLCQLASVKPCKADRSLRLQDWHLTEQSE